MKRNSLSTKLFAMLLCVVMVIGCLPLSAFATDWEGDIDLAPEGLNPENPIFLDLIYRWDNEEAQEGLQVMYYITDAEFDPTYFVTYGMPGQYTFSVTGEGDFSVTIDGEEVPVVDGMASKEVTLMIGAPFNFAISAGEGYYIDFQPVAGEPVIPVGADFDNAAILVEGANEATTLLSRQGEGMYYYKWTAPSDGVLTLSFNSYASNAVFANVEVQYPVFVGLTEFDDGTMEVDVTEGVEYGLIVLVVTDDRSTSEFSIQADFAETPTGPEVDESLVFYNKGIVLSADIRGVLQVRKMKATSPYVSFKVVAEKGGVETELELASVSDKTNYTTYSYAMTVPAKELADVTNLRIIGITEDGVEFTSNNIPWSIKEGLVSSMDTYSAQGTEDGALRTKLCANILHYGAEAQKHFSYNLDNLATDGLKEEYAALIITTTPEMEAIPKATEPSGTYATLTEIGFNLAARVQILPRFKVPKADSKESYTAEITKVHIAPDGTETTTTFIVEGDKILKGANSTSLYVYIDTLASKELRDVMTITLLKDGEPVSVIHTFSGESALYGKLDSLPALAAALMNYCDCARAVFG